VVVIERPSPSPFAVRISLKSVNNWGEILAGVANVCKRIQRVVTGATLTRDDPVIFSDVRNRWRAPSVAHSVLPLRAKAQRQAKGSKCQTTTTM
jgi:hypothetical protein